MGCNHPTMKSPYVAGCRIGQKPTRAGREIRRQRFSSHGCEQEQEQEHDVMVLGGSAAH